MSFVVTHRSELTENSKVFHCIFCKHVYVLFSLPRFCQEWFALWFAWALSDTQRGRIIKSLLCIFKWSVSVHTGTCTRHTIYIYTSHNDGVSYNGRVYTKTSNLHKALVGLSNAAFRDSLPADVLRAIASKSRSIVTDSRLRANILTYLFKRSAHYYFGFINIPERSSLFSAVDAEKKKYQRSLHVNMHRRCQLTRYVHAAWRSGARYIIQARLERAISVNTRGCIARRRAHNDIRLGRVSTASIFALSSRSSRVAAFIRTIPRRLFIKKRLIEFISFMSAILFKRRKLRESCYKMNYSDRHCLQCFIQCIIFHNEFSSWKYVLSYKL